MRVSTVNGMRNSARKPFDLTIIGAGPAAVAALGAISGGGRVCVVTGSRRHPVTKKRKVHPKIDAVCYERRETPGVAHFTPFARERKLGLFETATVGGLANYWGGQFVRYEENDPWPCAIFHDFEDYTRACRHIERMFVFSRPLGDGDVHAIWDDYVARTPRLLIGMNGAVPSGLLAMRERFLALTMTRQAELRSAPALSWEADGVGLRVILADGEKLRTKRLLLAAGGVGSVRLVMASCPEIKAVRLSDHAPYMLYASGLGQFFDFGTTDRFDHFNVWSVERIKNARVQLFASVYQMSCAPLSLSVSALGFPPMLRGWMTPRIADLVMPLQVWTEASLMQYRIDRGASRVAVTAKPEVCQDEELRSFLRRLKSHARLLRMSAAKSGAGFHYHAGEVSLDGISFIPMSSYLQNRFEGSLICIDPSALRKIGCRPHTLTAMAFAWQASTHL